MGSSNSDTGQIAKRYAKAWLAIANEAGELETIFNALASFKHILDEHTNLMAIFASPIIAESEKKGVAEQVLTLVTAPKNTVKMIANAIEHKRGNMLGAIIDAFEALYNEQNKIVRVEVTTANAVNDEARKAIEQKLSDAASHSVSVRYHVDASLLGGIRMIIGSRLLDASIAGQLQRLSNHMKQPTLA